MIKINEMIENQCSFFNYIPLKVNSLKISLQKKILNIPNELRRL